MHLFNQDAYVLAALLANSKCKPSSLPHALQIYDQIRQPKGNYVLNSSRANGLIYELNGAGTEDIGPHDDSVPKEKLEGLGKEASMHWDWAWSTSAEEDRKKALAML